MAKKCSVDKDACIGCGMCAAISAAAFAIGDDGKSICTLENGVVTDDVAASVDEAVASCPVQAIKVEE